MEKETMSILGGFTDAEPNTPCEVSPEDYQRANLLAQREARQNHQMGEWNGVKVYRESEMEIVAGEIIKDPSKVRELIKELMKKADEETLYDIKLTITDELHISHEDVEVAILTNL